MNDSNKIRAVFFDLDGCLVDARDIHYIALNKALYDIDPKYAITKEEHLSTFDGRSTTVKLEMLHESRGLPTNTFEQIWKKKQEYTLDVINTFEPDLRLQTILEKLVEEGYILVCASNSIRYNVFKMLEKKGILPYFTYYFSNQDVVHPKPHPEMYLKAMIACGVGPKETLILEDSHIGRLAALNSGAYLCPIIDPNDVTYEKIKSYLTMNSTNMQPKWRGGSMNIVIPMAGKGSRFAQAGYTFPKPLIPINKMDGKPMIQVVAENINVEGKYIYIVQKEHYEKYHLKTLLNLISPNCEIIQVEEVTEGAACTVLLAEKYINNDSQLFIINSDQYLNWDSNEFFYSMQGDTVDAGLATFEAYGIKWSYAKLGEDGFVSEVAEKDPISNIGSTGGYWFRHGKDFVSGARKMILNNKRVNNEFYVCPVLNELINDGKKVKIFPVDSMFSLGTPEDLQYFEENYENKQ